jgi:hypothetical protein
MILRMQLEARLPFHICFECGDALREVWGLFSIVKLMSWLLKLDQARALPLRL